MNAYFNQKFPGQINSTQNSVWRENIQKAYFQEFCITGAGNIKLHFYKQIPYTSVAFIFPLPMYLTDCMYIGMFTYCNTIGGCGHYCTGQISLAIGQTFTTAIMNRSVV